MFKWLSGAHNTRDWVGAAGNRSVSDDGDYVAAVNDALKSYAHSRPSSATHGTGRFLSIPTGSWARNTLR
jgi:hypothetical protein